jgi:hypothetical protein
MKCENITFTTQHCPIHFDYKLTNGQALKRVSHCKYLGITMSSNLSWRLHVNEIVRRANVALYFIKRNFRASPIKVKELLYLALVRPLLEYSSATWDPQHITQISHIEAVQRRAARFVLNDYNYTHSVTAMVEKLGWDDLTIRRKRNRLTCFYKTYFGYGGWSELANRVNTANYLGRRDHPFKVSIPKSKKDMHMYSFIGRTCRDWNDLPCSVIPALTNGTFAAFKRAVRSLQ